MPKAYVLFVNEERTIKVEIWPTKNSDGTSNYDFPETVTVATREDTADVWGPPINLVEEK
jgi:hypothetical protein